MEHQMQDMIQIWQANFANYKREGKNYSGKCVPVSSFVRTVGCVVICSRGFVICTWWGFHVVTTQVPCNSKTALSKTLRTVTYCKCHSSRQSKPRKVIIIYLYFISAVPMYDILQLKKTRHHHRKFINGHSHNALKWDIVVLPSLFSERDK